MHINKKNNITIGILNHDEKIFNKYIKKSIDQIDEEYEIIIKKDLKPAKAYNEIINDSSNDFIIFLHADVTFSSNLINCINKSIKQEPDFGAMGVVGVKKFFFKKKKYIKSNSNEMSQITVLDSCCILINKQHNLYFDNKNFDEYHHFVEDYCMQIKYKAKLKIFSMLINTYLPLDEASYLENMDKENYFIHHGSTFKNEGTKWGKWHYYKKRLDEKWGVKVVTT